MSEYKEWDQFVKERLAEFDIRKGSTFEAKLYLAYDEMRDIFTQKEYRLNCQTKILQQQNKDFREALELIKSCGLGVVTIANLDSVLEIPKEK